MRHAFAVHRLIAWYREGADVQAYLPLLATYLGHVNVSGTQAYLTMTPELLAEASKRFERYAAIGDEEKHDD
jgi:integrase/recombinase XerD